MIKKIIYKIILEFCRLLHKMPFKKEYIFICTPASGGSVGDQALLQGAIDGLYEKFGQDKFIVKQIVHSNWEPIEVINGCSHITFLGNYYGGFARIVLQLIRAKHFSVIGADMMDGIYTSEWVHSIIQLCNTADKLNIPTTIFGFSFSETPTDEAIKAIKSLNSNTQLCFRDPISKKRFDALIKRETRLVADLAFMLKPRLLSKNAIEAHEWIKQRKQKRQLVFAININAHPIDEGQRKSYFQAYAYIIEQLLSENENMNFVLLPHDIRGNVSDVVSLLSTKEMLSVKSLEKVHMLNPPFDAWEIKAIMKGIDLVITGRMHLAIAALGQGIPVICSVYYGKFEGLIEKYFNLTNCLVEPLSILNDPDNLKETIDNAMKNHKHLVEIINKSQKVVLKRSQSNFDGIV